jgi:hypothetical protein
LMSSAICAFLTVIWCGKGRTLSSSSMAAVQRSARAGATPSLPFQVRRRTFLGPRAMEGAGNRPIARNQFGSKVDSGSLYQRPLREVCFDDGTDRLSAVAFREI